MKRVILSVFLFLLAGGIGLSYAQYSTMSDFDLERIYLGGCNVKIKDDGRVDISGSTSNSNCYALGLLYSSSKSSLRSGQKKIGKQLISLSCQNGEKSACEFLRGGILVGTGSEVIYWGSIVVMGIAVLILFNMMFREESEYKAQEKLEGDEELKKDIAAEHGIVLKYSRPFFRRYITPVVNSYKKKQKIKEKYKRKLASAGLTEVLTPEDFFSFKLFLIVGFPIVFVAVRTFLEESWSLSLVAPIAVIGFIYPDIWINGKIQQRQKELIGAMPFAVDMLALSVEAGLDFVAAMTKVVGKARPSPLTYEFNQVMKEIRVGASRAEALRNMAWRCDLIQISSFCATLIAADSVGASIGPILKALSGEIRQKRSSDIEKLGATAATKILFPTLFLITPAVFLVVAAPLALGLIT